MIQIYPNPFNPTTTISFTLFDPGKVLLGIYDLSGRQVATLIDGYRDAGNHEVTFDGSGVASGVYIVQLQAKDFKANTKLVLIK